MNIRLNRLDGKGRIRILGVTIFKYGASGIVPDLFQTSKLLNPVLLHSILHRRPITERRRRENRGSKLLNPVLLHSNFAREADYRAPKARVRGVDNPYMPRTARG